MDPFDDPGFDDAGFDDGDVDPERLRECRYWRCGELFESRTTNHIFCRKACRSRQRKWERSVERKAARKLAAAARRRAVESGS